MSLMQHIGWTKHLRAWALRSRVWAKRGDVLILGFGGPGRSGSPILEYYWLQGFR